MCNIWSLNSVTFQAKFIFQIQEVEKIFARPYLGIVSSSKKFSFVEHKQDYSTFSDSLCDDNQVNKEIWTKNIWQW